MDIIEALALAKFGHLCAVMGLFGSCLSPLCEVARLRGTAIQTGRLLRSIHAVATGAALVSGLAWLVCSFVDMRGRSINFLHGRTLAIFLLQTGFGKAWGVSLFSAFSPLR
jgi:hypothetical protein